MQKRADPNKEQAECIRRAGLVPHEFTVIRELDRSLFIRHRVTGEFKMISKGI